MTNSNQSLSELVAALGDARRGSSELYDQYKQAKNHEDTLRYQLEFKLRTEGLKSVKGENFNAVMTEKPRIVIKNETAVIEWLRNTPNVEADFYIGVKSAPFQLLAKTIMKEEKELIPGTEVEVSESLAIRSNKREEK